MRLTARTSYVHRFDQMDLVMLNRIKQSEGGGRKERDGSMMGEKSSGPLTARLGAKNFVIQRFAV